MITEADMIRRCNVFLACLWDRDHPLIHRSIQHRDLVRTFFAGVMETLMALDDNGSAHSLLSLYEAMCEPHWLPDSRFQVQEESR